MNRARRIWAVGVLAVGASVLAGSPSTSAADLAPAWGDLVNLSVANVGSYPVPRIVVDADGSTMVAAWVDAGNNLEASVGTSDGSTVTWTPRVEIASGVLGYSFISLAMTPDGTSAVALWATSGGMMGAVASIASGVATWGSGQLVSGSENPSNWTDLDISDDGSTVAAVWVRQLSTSGSPGPIVRGVVGAVSGTTITWDSVEDLAISGGFPYDDVRAVDVAIDPAGQRTIAAWSRRPAGDTAYKVEAASAAVAAGNATWGAATQMSDVSDDAASPSLEISADGSKAVLVWAVSTSPDYPMVSRVATITSGVETWGSPVEIATATEAPGYVDVDLSGTGSKALVAWSTGSPVAPTYSRVSTAVASISGSTPTWGSVTVIDRATRTSDMAPSVSLAGDGARALMAFVGFTNAYTSGTFASTGTIEGRAVTWGTPTPLSPTGANGSIRPVVALNSSGLAGAAIWQQGYPYYVAARTFTMEASSQAPSGARVRYLTRGDRSITVTIGQPADAGSSAVTRHQARCVSDGTVKRSDPAASTTHVVKGLTNGVQYDCSTRAKNASGWSAWSETLDMFPSTKPAELPPPPEVKSVDPAVVGATVRLARPDPRGGSSIIAYAARCERKGSTTVSDSGTEKRFDLTGMTYGVTWKCSGRVRTGMGWSDWSDTTKVVPQPRAG